MNLSEGTKKWLAVVLGVVSLALAVRLVSQVGGVRAGNLTPVATSPREPAKKATDKGGRPVDPDLQRYDPVVRLDALDKLDERPLPEIARNPFEFPPVRVVAKNNTPTAAAPPPPPPPPPVTLKVMGYSDGIGGQSQAYVCDAPPGAASCGEKDEVYQVHEGDTVSNRYKVLKITPNMLTVQDAQTHQTVELPIPQ